MVIKTKIEVELKPMTVPNYVMLLDGKSRARNEEHPKCALSDLSSEQAVALIEKFIFDYWEKVGFQKRPPEITLTTHSR